MKMRGWEQIFHKSEASECWCIFSRVMHLIGPTFSLLVRVPFLSGRFKVSVTIILKCEKLSSWWLSLGARYDLNWLLTFFYNEEVFSLPLCFTVSVTIILRRDKFVWEDNLHLLMGVVCLEPASRAHPSKYTNIFPDVKFIFNVNTKVEIRISKS